MAQTSKDKPNPNQGKTPFITANTAMQAFEESRKWMQPYFEPIDELERLARNRPSSNIPKDLPKVTDGTLAAIIQEQPKRIVQQLATGAVRCDMYPEYAAVADVVMTDKLIPLSHTMGTELQKSWNMLGKAMTWGRATSYCYFTTSNGVRHVEWIIPYVKDIFTERGKVYGPDSNIRFMRSWYQKRDLQAIINREKMLTEKLKGYVSGWDLASLAEFMQSGASSKRAESLTPAEREKGGDNGGFEIIHAYQTGIGAEFYSFAPRFNDGKALRTKVNNDPSGRDPFNDLYCNIDLSSPLGRGQVELSGGVQNLIDQQMQMYQFITTMNMGPVVITSGNVNHATLKYRPNAIWKKGSPNDTIEIAKMDNTFINNYPNNYGLLKSQILNLNSAQDHSISGAAGTPTQSKTQAGVQAQESRLGTSDNYLRKQFEAWDGARKQTQLNIFFSEMNDTDSIELGPQQIKTLESSPAKKFIKNGKLEVNYGDVSKATFLFKVDEGSTKIADDQAQLEKIQEILQEVGQNGLVLNYYLAQDGVKLNVGELYKQRFNRLGFKDIDSILTEMDPKEAEAAKQQPFPIIDKPQIRINTADLTADQISAALAAGGVNLAPNQQPPQPGQPPAGLSPQGIADFMVEMTKAQATASVNPTTGADPNELAIKQQQIDLKQQEIQIKAHDSMAKAQQAQQAHGLAESQHNLATIQAIGQEDPAMQAQQQQQPQQQQQQQPEVESPQEDSTDTMPEQQEPDHANLPVQQHEQQLVHDLLQAGFDENDVEQGIIMLRQGMSEQQVIQTLQHKKGMAMA